MSTGTPAPRTDLTDAVQACVRAQIWGASGTWPLQLDLDLIAHEGRWRVRDARASTW